MRIPFLFFLVFGVNLSAAQANFAIEIIGTWKLHSDEIVNVEDEKSSDPFINKHTTFTFKPNETIIFVIDNFELQATYTLKETVLTIGNRNFIVLNVTEEELLFTEKNDATGVKHTYKRIKNNE